MALPAEKTAWPPEHDADRYRRMGVNSVWYAGDPARLASLYGSTSPRSREGQHVKQGVLGMIRDWFWGTSDFNEPDDKVHLPVAQGLAVRSSELLFSHAPKFVVQPVVFDAAGKVPPEHRAEVARTQDRLDTILDGMGFDSVLLAAGETQAALGSVGLRIAYDPATMASPVITRVDADACLPEYAYGQLRAVTFWRVARLDRSSGDVWRHLERHEQGRVQHALFVGTVDNLGERRALDTIDETAAYAAMVDAEGFMDLVPGHMLATTVPNMLPDPLNRQNQAGRSDFTPGVLTLFDSIDRTVTSLMRDIEDGRSRLLVAESLLDNIGTGKGVGFNQDQHLFMKMNAAPTEDAKGGLPIEQVQFNIRVEEHLRALDWLVTKAHHEAGYNTDAETGEGAQPMTATEYQGRAKRDLNTASKKQRYWRDRLQPFMQTLLAVDAQVFNSGVRADLPVVMEFAPAAPRSDKAQAEVVELWERSKAASLKTKVWGLHPEWSEDMVDAEVLEIQEQTRLADPTMLPGDPGAAGGPLTSLG